MTPAELYQALNSLGLPIVYGHFPNPVEPPYLTYTFSYSNDLMADGHNYFSIDNYQIELYTQNKDVASEKLVESKLKELKLPYMKIEAYLESEKLYQIVYEVQLLGG